MSDRLDDATVKGADFLLELLSEEIPARMQEKAVADLARLFEGELAKAGLKPSAIETLVTPRRLALIVRGLPQATEAVSEELKGPRADAPPQALAGFLGKTGLTREQLVERADAKGNMILFAVIEKPGRPTTEVLAEAIPTIVRAFPWPKSMRWGAPSASSESPRWVRPLQGIVALFGGAVVPFEIAGVTSGRETAGHRFLHDGSPVSIADAASYAETLRAAHVIADTLERRLIVREEAEEAAAIAGFVLVEDEGLVHENAGLTEWPVPLLGQFDPAFLTVPREVIQLTMRTNQKYFACTDGEGHLAPAFICTANIIPQDGGAAIIAGNAKVLAARLSDARFFWEQDLKVPLAEQAKKLGQIVFHEKLGTVADKVERVAKLAEWLASEGIVPNCDPALARQAAELCKADLVTGMVGEFPELQGVMGGYYARAEGLPDAVADAIRDHYKPVGQGDEVPTAPVTVAVSLADKLDTVLSFFIVFERPSGSRDPFALRRAILGAIRLIVANGLRAPLATVVYRWVRNLIEFGYSDTFSDASIILDGERIGERLRMAGYFRRPIWEDRTGEWEKLGPMEHRILLSSNLDRPEWVFEKLGFVAEGQGVELGKEYHEDASIDIRSFESASEQYSDFLSFLSDRLKVQQREAGVRHDLIDAVFALGGEDDLVRLLARVKALQAFVETEDGANLLAGYRRAANILRAEAKKDGQAPEPFAGFAGYTPDAAEAALADALATQLPKADAAIAQEEFAEAMTALSVLRPAIDRFFDDVTVNSQDETQRRTRLALLDKFRAAMHNIADFSKIEG